MTKRRPARAYMHVIYTPIYVIHVIYALERFIFNIFCVNRRIYFIRLFYNVPNFRYGYFEMFTSYVADNDVTIAGRARAAMRRCHWLPVFAI